jgi:peptidylprolyl isomerase
VSDAVKKDGRPAKASATAGGAAGSATKQAPAKRASARPASTKAERRAAFRAARAKAAKRRRQKRIAAWVGVAVVVVVGVVYLIFGGKDEPATTAAAPCGAATFPPVPAGAATSLCTKPTVTAGTGDVTTLNVTTLVRGTGAAAANGQTITVNYVGVSYKTGEEFDASWNVPKPYTFQLGAGAVIPGWDQGLVGVTVGSRVQLDIPSNLAYGDNPTDRPGGPLRFVVDLLAVA